MSINRNLLNELIERLGHKQVLEEVITYFSSEETNNALDLIASHHEVHRDLCNCDDEESEFFQNHGECEYCFYNVGGEK